jgi:hypothetical protein
MKLFWWQNWEKAQMISIFLLLAAIVVSSVIGWRFSRRPRRGRFRVLQIFLSLCLAVAVAIASLIVFAYFDLTVPAADDSDLRSETHLEFHSSAGSRNSQIILAYKPKPAVDYDYQIVVRIEGISVGPQLYRLVTSKSIALRTADRCKNSTLENVACSSSDNPNEVRWEATPQSGGSTLTTLILPDVLRPAHLLGPTWTATAQVDGEYVLQSGLLGQPGYNPQWGPERRNSYGINIGVHKAYMLNSVAPGMSYQDWSVDLASGQIRFTTDVVRTLGVSASTYGTLVVVGTIASGALGSGWVFKLFDLLLYAYRRRKVPSGSSSDEE